MRFLTVKSGSSQNSLPVTIGAALALAIGAGAVAAQTVGGNSGGYAAQQSTTQRSTRSRQQPATSTTTSLSSVIAQMGQYAGVQILADRSVANYPVTAPTEQTTTANIDDQIKAIVAQLPGGSVSGKFYLPAASTHAYTADSVEEFAMAESKLFGPVGGPQTAGTVEILGQKLTADKATAAISALNLQPLYLIGNPSASQQSQQSSNFGSQGNTGNSANSGSYGPPNGGVASSTALTTQAQSLLNMSAGQRDQALLQLANDNQQTISQVLQNVPASERQQLLQSLRGTSSGSTGSSSSFGGGSGRRGGPGGPGGQQ